MAVDFTNSQLTKHMKQIKTVNDVYDGVDTAKKYIVQMPQEEDNTFFTRTENATLKNYVQRSIEAMVGMVYRKPISTVGYSDEMLDIFNNVDLNSTLNQFSRKITDSAIRNGIAYILVDNSEKVNRPYWMLIERLDLINWKKDLEGNFTQAVIREYTDTPLDEFETESVEQFRVYDDKGNITIYRSSGNSGFEVVDVIDTGLDYIPLVEVKINDIPPMYDIAKLNIKHMNRTSVKDRYLDMAACPVPVIWGANVDDDGYNETSKPALIIGVDEAFIFNGTKDEADFQWRELSGSSIDKLQEDLSVIEDEITTGVIRASSADTTTMKTATQSYYEASEAANRVTVIANILDFALNKASFITQDYISDTASEPVAVIKVNKDYIAMGGNSDDSRVLMEAYLNGVISYDTFIQSLNKMEITDIPSIEEEIYMIENSKFKPQSLVNNTDTDKNKDNRLVSVEE